MSIRTKDRTALDVQRAADAARSLVDELNTNDGILRHDMIEGETGLFEAIEAAIAEIDECDIIVNGCQEKVSELSSRISRAARRSEKLRGLIEQAMVIAELPSAKLATATITVKTLPPKPHYADESLIPAEYWKQADPVIDRAKILAAFKDGTEIPGINATNGTTSLQIRRA